MIFVTDGESNVNADQTLPEARLLHNARVGLLGIGINLFDTTELSGIASNQRYLQIADDFDSLPTIVPELVRAVCTGNYRVP